MSLITDLHIHSKYARGCSKDLDLKNLEKFARIKGIDVLGSGDFTHPKWIGELKSQLTENGSGILRTATGYPFVLQTEIGLVFKQGGHGRRVHMLILAPSFAVVAQITEMLLKRGRIDYDGRPVFGMSAIALVEECQRIDPRIELIPAHAWTPWYAIFGSKSGFDSLQECFQEKTKHIHAIETGMSSDPPMNWRISSLDNINLVSFSDSHSYWPWRLGREATIFNLNASELTYDQL
ncbi:MAG TPA: endonuclease Q family protein, partial [Candidatus Nanoarchaeia archaeon]|nr:endonuclease Q family protein [Candidatus Nanoarchaeia archaeon]